MLGLNDAAVALLFGSEKSTMPPGEYRSISNYVGFDDDTADVLRALYPICQPQFTAIVDDFYRAVEQDALANAVITGGPAQVERLKGTLVAWLERLLRGPYDDDYLQLRLRIGRVHVRIGLPQQFMFSAMNRIRTQLVRLVLDAVTDSEQRARAVAALDSALDLELAIMLHSYREDLVERMRVRERLATVGQMAATIAHELRNPLGTVQSSLYLIEQRLAKSKHEDPVLEKHLGRIAAQVDLCATTISNLLELARDRPPSVRKAQLGPLLDRAVEIAQLSEGVVLRRALGPDACEVSADPEQLSQVFVNLLVNAAEAMDGRGTIEVSSSLGDNGVFISFQDDGPGIAKEHQLQIFEVLFTTKATGTGLGLGLCRKVIEAHHGKLELVPSEVGAHFRMWLPS